MALWFLPLIQEETYVGWDIACFPIQIGLLDKLIILYLFGCLIASLVVLLRSWWALGFLDRRTKRNLTGVRRGIEGGDWEGAKNVLLGVPARSPEGGLRRCVEEGAGIGTADLKHTLEEANLTFDYEQGRLRVMVGRLMTAGVCAVLFSVLATVSNVVDMLEEIGNANVFGSRAVLCGVSEALVFVPMALFVFILIFLVDRHTSSRLAVRRNHWDYFMGSVRLWLDGRSWEGAGPGNPATQGG